MTITEVEFVKSDIMYACLRRANGINRHESSSAIEGTIKEVSRLLTTCPSLMHCIDTIDELCRYYTENNTTMCPRYELLMTARDRLFLHLTNMTRTTIRRSHNKPTTHIFKRRN